MTTECSAEGTYAGSVHNFRATGDRGDGHAAAERLGHDDQVRLDSKMFAGEPLSSTRKAGLHFIGNEENSVLAADFLEKRKVLFRRNDKSAFAQYRLRDDGGDRFGRHAALESIFQMMCEGLRGCAFLAAIRIGERYAVDVAGKRLETGFVRMRFAGKRHGQQSASVKSVFKADHGGALGVGAR